MSRIVTFYSYKGGVGRTFALANIAVLLARRGKRVLLMDWDLEAPGLHRYFKPYLAEEMLPRRGLIHLVSQAVQNPNVTWKQFTTEIWVDKGLPLTLIPSGDQAPDYIELVRNLSWNAFFEVRQGGSMLDKWRKEWKAEFDFVLIDSRTGITDAGGICTVYLPDILVFVFSANEQSFDRGIQIILGVQEARRHLNVPRSPAAILPIPGRFDSRDEVDESRNWLDRFGRGLKVFYDDWLPKKFEPRQILELTKIPYITKFSFGEPLPVITHGVSDPEFPGFFLDNVARLLASDFNDATQILAPESSAERLSIAQFRAQLAQVPIDETAVNQALNLVENDIGESTTLSEVLNEAGVALMRQGRLLSAESCFRRALAIIERQLGMDDPSAVASLNHLGELMHQTKRLFEAELFYRRVMELLERTADVDNPAVISAYSNLASVLRDLKRLPEAEEMYRRTLQKLQLTSRPDDPALINAYNNLATMLRETGRLFEAKEMYAQALHSLEMTLRPDDQALISANNNLAALLSETGRAFEAEKLYRRAAQRLEQTSRSDDPAVISSYNNLAAILRDNGRWWEAAEVYERMLQTLETTSRADDPIMINVYNNYANVLRESGRWTEAADVYQRALRKLEMTRPEDPSLVRIYNDYAALLREGGRLTEAESAYRKSLELLELTNGPESVATLNNLGEVLLESRRFSEAENLFRRALTQLQSGVFYDSPDAMKIRRNLSYVLDNMGEPYEARQIFQQLKFDTILLHDYRDMRTIRLLAKELQARGLRVFLDEWEVAPGVDWVDTFERLKDSLASAVLSIGAEGFRLWDRPETRFILNHITTMNRPVVPILLPGAPADPKLPQIVAIYNWVDLREGITKQGIDRVVWGITGLKPREQI